VPSGQQRAAIHSVRNSPLRSGAQVGDADSPSWASQPGAAATAAPVRHKDFDRTDLGTCPGSASAAWPVRRCPARGKLLHDPGTERRQRWSRWCRSRRPRLAP